MEKETLAQCSMDMNAAAKAAANHHGLKRTISKCSMEDGLYQNDSPTFKKFAIVGEAAAHADTAVLLARRTDMAHSSDSSDEPEVSPMTFGWENDSPGGVKDRYYEHLMDPSHLVSPSPRHMMYGGNDATADGGRDYLTAANLHTILLEYIRDVFVYYNRATTFTFAQLGQMLRSVPYAFRYIQSIVKDRLGLSWHLVGSFVENVIDFICDEDIRDAAVVEFAGFLKNIQDSAVDRMPTGNIFANLFEFFRDVLHQFKQYLIKLWLQSKRIDFPCEFGKKSDTLFLCMECHREHF